MKNQISYFYPYLTLMTKVIEASSLRGGFTEKSNFEWILMLFILSNNINYELRKWIMSFEYF